jgi:cation transport ATPase
MCSVDGVLKEIFLGIIGGKTSILKQVNNIVFDGGLGLSASVGGKAVLIGNRDLMIKRGIDTPSRDFEKRFIKSDREILYLANSGEVTAMFVLSYKPNPDMLTHIAALERQGINLIVRSSAPYITIPKIASDFGFPRSGSYRCPPR